MSTKSVSILAAIGGILGAVMLITSFSINPGPPSNATSAQLIAFGNQNFTSILWGPGSRPSVQFLSCFLPLPSFRWLELPHELLAG
jgi:hypothetical protein